MNAFSIVGELAEIIEFKTMNNQTKSYGLTVITAGNFGNNYVMTNMRIIDSENTQAIVSLLKKHHWYIFNGLLYLFVPEHSQKLNVEFRVTSIVPLGVVRHDETALKIKPNPSYIKAPSQFFYHVHKSPLIVEEEKRKQKEQEGNNGE